MPTQMVVAIFFPSTFTKISSNKTFLSQNEGYMTVTRVTEFIARVPKSDKIGSLFSLFLKRVVSIVQHHESLQSKCPTKDFDDLL